MVGGFDGTGRHGGDVDGGRVGAGVVGFDRHVHEHFDFARQATHAAQDRVFGADGGGIGLVERGDGHAIGDLDLAVVVGEDRGEDVGVLHVVTAARAAVLDAHRAVAGVGVQHAGEHRRRIEAFRAPPLDRAVARDEGNGVAVTDEAVVRDPRQAGNGTGDATPFRHCVAMTTVRRDTRRADRIRAAICVTLVARRGESMSIGELVDALREMGLELPGDGRANKIVSDAIRWEVRRGRVRQMGRGRYATGGHIPRSTLHYMRVRIRAYVEDPTRGCARPMGAAGPEGGGVPDTFGLAGAAGPELSDRLAAWDSARRRPRHDGPDDDPARR